MIQDFDPVWEFRVVFDAYDDAMAMQVLGGLCEGVIRANMIWISEAGDRAPCCLSEAGVRYVSPIGCGSPHPCQTVRGAAEILEKGVATCIDIAPYMAAQLRLRGQGATVVFVNMRDHAGNKISGMYHALVQLSKGKTIDYTQDLIDGNTARCAEICSKRIKK